MSPKTEGKKKLPLRFPAHVYWRFDPTSRSLSTKDRGGSAATQPDPLMDTLGKIAMPRLNGCIVTYEDTK